MSGIVNKGGQVSLVKTLTEVQAAFGRERPVRVHVFGFENADLSWVTAATRYKHASIVLHVKMADAAEMIAQQGWREPIVHARRLPHSCALPYLDDVASDAGEDKKETPRTGTVHVRRTRIRQAA